MVLQDENPYKQIGVRSFINCCGTRTIHSGTLMLRDVREAMMAASRHFVNMDELMAGVGTRLGELTGAQWGMVAPGAAAALCHATAACVTGGDPELMLRLPDTTGMKNKVIMPRESRFTYDHAIRSIGVMIVEVDTLAEMDRALQSEQAAMVAILGTWETTSDMALEDVIAVASKQKVPVLVDAASEHLITPEPYIARGANLVAYSGGKFLRGPQPTGLLLGDRDLVEAAWVHAAPHHTFGRSMKIGKEEVMGVLAAVEYTVLERDHKTEHQQWLNDLETIAEVVTKVAGVKAEVLSPAYERSAVPRLEIRWDGKKIGMTGLELRAHLLEGEPRIMLDDRGATDVSIFILPFSLQAGEAQIVGEVIGKTLSNAPAPVVADERTPVDVSGRWEIEILHVRKSATHRVTLNQSDTILAGSHKTHWLENPLTGFVKGNRVVFTSQHRFEGTHLAYRFDGTLQGEALSGSVEIGSSGQSAPGPLNQREYGTKTWRAKRISQ